MNIIVQDCNGVISCRPDTTRDREGRNLFAPDFVSGYSYAPVLFARVSKVGKCVGTKFATRYYDAVNYGILLYPETKDGLSTIMDRTSFLPVPMYERVVMETRTNAFEIIHNGKPLFSTTTAGGNELIEQAVLNTSKYMLLRMGDLIAVELAAVAPLPSADEHRIAATFCGNHLFDFYIK